ncbi:MAG: hypothetical protein HXX16_06545 [Bacteroidales bacterium]|nr:hypothetical protein [Bacteroidales bacterium]
MKNKQLSLTRNCNFSFFRNLSLGTLILFVSIFIQSCGPKTKEVPLTYLIKDNKLFYDRESGATLLGVNPKLKVYTTITNTSDYGGVFKFYAKLSSQGNTVEFSEEQFIASGQAVTFSQVKDINPYSFQTNVQVDDWGIIAPTKTIDVK